MGDTRGMRALVAMVLLMATGVVTLASAPAAVAAGGLPDQCVQSQSGRSVQFDSAVPLEDIDVRVWLGGRELNSALYLVNGRDFQMGQRWLLADQFSGINRNGYVSAVTFDNQAPAGPNDPPSGSDIRVRPEQALPSSWWSTNDYSFYVGQGGNAAPSYDIVVTIVWADCDEDRDFSGDKTRDNCVGLHNPDQRDLDADGRGDACDPDDDNDGVADTSDNCPTTANADQTDWDGDRIGNACDTTPGTAPSAPTAPTPAGTTPPGTTPGCTAGCAYARTVGLRHRTARHRFTGAVGSVALGCRSGVDVTLWRKRSGADRKLVVVTTRASGTFRTKAPRRAGRYYATVATPAQQLCGDATSRVVRIKRR